MCVRVSARMPAHQLKWGVAWEVTPPFGLVYCDEVVRQRTPAWGMGRAALGGRTISNAKTHESASGGSSNERADQSVLSHIRGFLRQPSNALPPSAVLMEGHDPHAGAEGDRRTDAVRTVSAVLVGLSSRLTSLASEDSDRAPGPLVGTGQLETKVEDIRSFVASRKKSILEMMRTEEGGGEDTRSRLAELAQSYSQLESMLRTGRLEAPHGAGLRGDQGEG